VAVHQAHVLIPVVHDDTGDIVQDAAHLLREFASTFNPLYTRWNDEFELDAATRPDSIRKSFYIPYLDKQTAKMVLRVFCKYTSDLADGMHS
jgi:hypothetical protein